MLKKFGRKDKKDKAGMAEFKLLTFLLYTVMAVITSASFDSHTSPASPNDYIKPQYPYFFCESNNIQGIKDCQGLLKEPQLNILTVVSLVLNGCLPLAVFLFIADFKLYIATVKKVKGCLKVKLTKIFKH